jgi:hypothetical protein
LIYFLADDHYGARPGATLWTALDRRFGILFEENGYAALQHPDFADRCSLLILSLIAGTQGGGGLAGAAEEQNVRDYLERGGPVLLQHGGSAAFWHWPWWRAIVGYRWVRGQDPDGVVPSEHPIRPYRVDVATAPHPLAAKLKSMDLPEDEIYIRLQQTCPATTLMSTTIAEGTFPQCYESVTPWGGTLIGFLPGHKPEVVRLPELVGNVQAIIDYLLAVPHRSPVKK